MIEASGYSLYFSDDRKTAGYNPSNSSQSIFSKSFDLNFKYKDPSWFWGIASLGLQSSSVNLKTVAAISKGRMDVDIVSNNTFVNEISINYVAFDDALPIYVDIVSIDNTNPVKIPFNQPFKQIPIILTSIQEIEAKNLKKLSIEVTEIKKNYCKIKASFPLGSIQSIRVGVFAYEKTIGVDHVTTSLVESGMKKDLIQIMSDDCCFDDIKKESSKHHVVTLKNYKNLPSAVSFLTGFELTQGKFYLSTSAPFYSFTEVGVRLSTHHSNFSNVQCYYLICGPLVKSNKKQKDYFKKPTVYQEQQKPTALSKCKIVEKGSLNSCSFCGMHEINTVLKCGHAVYCGCCSTNLPTQHKCPICSLTSFGWEEFIQFSFE
ncbi:RING-type domain-containing protein [Entamoeba marina]